MTPATVPAAAARRRALGHDVDALLVVDLLGARVAERLEALGEGAQQLGLARGEVPHVFERAQRHLLRKVATQHRGVARVINQLEIAGKATVISEINDLTISTQVKALVLKDLGRNVYQRTLITTENSNVYVMGFVTKTEAAALENVVSSVRGVKRIVRVFEYID